jgi:hypothetical protein
MSDPDSEPQEKKVIVDEDWKAQVQAEKEALKKKQEAPPQDASGDAAERETPLPLPPATLEVLVTSLATQAMMAMGFMPHPVSGKTEVQLDSAKHFIDTLGMLEEKTEGNRTPEESTLLDRLLHELRLGYVSARQQGG